MINRLPPRVGLLFAFVAFPLTGLFAQPGPDYRETSITLGQIVARQEENYKRISNAEGEVVWREDNFTSSAKSKAPPVRVIFFAFEGDKSVNLVLPWEEASAYPHRNEKLHWDKVLSACLVDGEVVKQVGLPQGRAGATLPAPEVHSVPFNPAVHEKNPLVAFKPRMLGDERVGLADLAAVASQMPTRPLVRQFKRGNDLLLRIDFQNASAPGELLYYIINPAKGCLAEEIGRISGGRIVALTRMVIGKTSDGTWIPARREKFQFDSSGRLVSSESWSYQLLLVNQGLARKELSLDYFHIGQETKVQ